MAAIKTKEALQEYILRKLGSPVISIEVDETQIFDNIDDAIQKFSFEALSGEEVVALLVTTQKGVRDFVLDDRVQSVIDLRHQNSFGTSLSVGNNWVLDASYFVNSSVLTSIDQLDTTNMAAITAKLSALESMFNVPLAYDFNYNTKILRFYEDPNVNQILLKVALEYKPKEIDNIYNSTWVKRYATALTKLTWGNNLGKYNGTLINGSSLNYDRIISEAQTEIDKLEEELRNTYSAPLPIYVF